MCYFHVSGALGGKGMREAAALYHAEAVRVDKVCPVLVVGDELPCLPGRDPLVVWGIRGGLQQEFVLELFLVRCPGATLGPFPLVVLVSVVLKLGLEFQVRNRDAVIPKLLAPIIVVLYG